MARTWNTIAPLSAASFGVLYAIINEVPDMSIRLQFNEILAFCGAAHENDPFAVVYLFDDERRWYKGEHCYANQRYKFLPVGLAAIPDVILMMQVCQP